jgi:hypothetical protein
MPSRWLRHGGVASDELLDLSVGEPFAAIGQLARLRPRSPVSEITRILHTRNTV